MTHAQEWSRKLHWRIAQAVRDTRGRQKLSAQELADRTGKLGYPISRSAIANLECGRKQSLDVAELLVLAAALSTSPVALVHPGPYREPVAVVPGVEELPEIWAAQWFSGLVSGVSEVPYEARNITVGDFATYDDNHVGLNRARERVKLEERRTALRYELARRRARNTAKDDPETVSQLIDDVADLTRRIDEIDGFGEGLDWHRLDQENNGEAK